MKLYCLSSHPNKSCNILKFKNTTIMLDCGLDMTSALSFLPLPLIPSSRLFNLPTWTPRNVSDPLLEGELRECAGRVFIDSCPEFCLPEELISIMASPSGLTPLSEEKVVFPSKCKTVVTVKQDGIIDFSEVDLILISNYQNMMALPYITEGTGFKGFVYATEPTLQIGRMFMEELVTYIERTPKIRVASKWKQANILKNLPPTLCDSIKPRSWKQLYTMKEINSCLSKVQVVGFAEKLDVYGAMKVSAVSSGYCLGSCNWVIWSAHEKIGYISASSTLTTHPKSLEQPPLKNCDVLFLSSLTQTPLSNPDSMLGELCVTAAVTVKNGGNVLIPCYPSGITFDLFECLSAQLESGGHMNVPMYFLSPVADNTLAYSNILAEWLSTSKQSKVYSAEEPFPHASLIRSGRIKSFSSLTAESFSQEFRTPCIVFAGHPSLRFGDSVHFMELWANSSNNAVIFTEPDFPYLEAIAPYQPLAMKALYYPIDTSLSFNQANKLIRELKPHHLLLPEQYTVPPAQYRHRTDLIIDTDYNIIPFKRGDVIQVPIRRRYERIDMDSEFAGSLMPLEVKPGISVVTVTGELHVKNNKYELKRLQKSDSPPPANKKKKTVDDPCFPSSYAWGPLDVSHFVQKLTKAGIEAKVEESSTGFIIDLQNDDVLIRVEDHSTHIISSGDSTVRPKLHDLLLECLNKF